MGRMTSTPADGPPGPRVQCRGRLASTALAVVVVYLVSAGASASAAVRVPRGFFAKRVLRLQQPTALAFTPDRELLVASKLGRLLVLEPGAPAPRKLLDLRRHICHQ